jgi:hypothetical protein
MSESPNAAATGAGPRATDVADLDPGSRAATEETASGSGGRGWKLLSLVLFALLLMSGGLNYMQQGAQGALETSAAELADVLTAETARADAAEQEASALRSALGDVYTNMASLQASLGQMIATTGGILETANVAQTDEEASALDGGVETAASGGELPDVAATPAASIEEDTGAAEEGRVSSALSNAWTSTRDGVSNLVERVREE